MECKICRARIEHGILVPAEDGVSTVIENICPSCKYIEDRIKQDKKYNYERVK